MQIVFGDWATTWLVDSFALISTYFGLLKFSKVLGFLALDMVWTFSVNSIYHNHSFKAQRKFQTRGHALVFSDFISHSFYHLHLLFQFTLSFIVFSFSPRCTHFKSIGGTNQWQIQKFTSVGSQITNSGKEEFHQENDSQFHPSFLVSMLLFLSSELNKKSL